MTTKIMIRLIDIDPSYSREEAVELVRHLQDIGWEQFALQKIIKDANGENTIREIYMRRE